MYKYFIFSENIGESIIYQWIVCVQDFINGPDVSETSRTFEDCSAELAESFLAVELCDQVKESYCMCFEKFVS